MTLLQRYLAFYVEVCQRSQPEKAAAWRQAQQAAKDYPDLLADLPKLLEISMVRLNASSNSETASSNAGTLPKPQA